MAHNPPRIWMTPAQQRAVSDATRRQLARWGSLEELADKMMDQAAQGKRVVLSPATAEYLARWVKEQVGREP